LSLSLFEANFVTFVKAFESFPLYFGEVHKQVLSSIFRSDESIPFGLIEHFTVPCVKNITSFPVY